MARCLAIIVALGLSLVTAASASAVTVVTAAPSAKYQRWIFASKVPTPDIRLEVTHDVEGFCRHRPGGCAGFSKDDRRFPTIAVWPWSPRWMFEHELGHHFDFAYLDEGWRDRFNALFGIDTPWSLPYPERGAGESFADLYRLCMTRHRVEMKPWALRDRPFGAFHVRLKRRQVLRGCRMIWAAYGGSPMATGVPPTTKQVP